MSVKLPDGQNGLHIASRNDNCASIIEYLLEIGFEIDKASAHKLQPIHYAAREGLVENLKVLLSHGAKINAKSEKGMTPLHLAVINNREGAVKYLMLEGATDIPDDEGVTPSAIAFKNDELNDIAVLFMGDSNISTLSELNNRYEAPPSFISAVQNGKLEIKKKRKRKRKTKSELPFDHPFEDATIFNEIRQKNTPKAESMNVTMEGDRKLKKIKVKKRKIVKSKTVDNTITENSSNLKTNIKFSPKILEKVPSTPKQKSLAVKKPLLDENELKAIENMPKTPKLKSKRKTTVKKIRKPTTELKTSQVKSIAPELHKSSIRSQITKKNKITTPKKPLKRPNSSTPKKKVNITASKSPNIKNKTSSSPLNSPVVKKDSEHNKIQNKPKAMTPTRKIAKTKFIIKRKTAKKAKQPLTPNVNDIKKTQKSKFATNISDDFNSSGSLSSPPTDENDFAPEPVIIDKISVKSSRSNQVPPPELKTAVIQPFVARPMKSDDELITVDSIDNDGEVQKLPVEQLQVIPIDSSPKKKILKPKKKIAPKKSPKSNSSTQDPPNEQEENQDDKQLRFSFEKKSDPVNSSPSFGSLKSLIFSREAVNVELDDTLKKRLKSAPRNRRTLSINRTNKVIPELEIPKLEFSLQNDLDIENQQNKFFDFQNQQLNIDFLHQQSQKLNFQTQQNSFELLNQQNNFDFNNQQLNFDLPKQQNNFDFNNQQLNLDLPKQQNEFDVNNQQLNLDLLKQQNKDFDFMNQQMNLVDEKSQMKDEETVVNDNNKIKIKPSLKLEISADTNIETKQAPKLKLEKSADAEILTKSSIDPQFDEKMPKDEDSPRVDYHPMKWTGFRNNIVPRTQTKMFNFKDIVDDSSSSSTDEKIEKKFEDLSQKINEINQKLTNMNQPKSEYEIVDNSSLYRATDDTFEGGSEPHSTIAYEEEEFFEEEINEETEEITENYEKYEEFIGNIKASRYNAVQSYMNKEHPKIVTSRGSTPLHVAAHYEQPNIVNMILRMNEINIDAVDSHGMTALGRACEIGSFEIAKTLIENGAKTDIIDGKGHKAIDATNKNNFTILHRESASGNYQNVKYLLKHGSTPTMVSNKGTVAIDGVNERGETLLHIKTREGDLKAVKYLIANDINACIRDKDGLLPIHIASKQKDEALRHQLMEEISFSMTKSSTDFIDMMMRNSKLFKRNKDKYLKKAINFCASAVIPFLLNNGCACDTINEDGCSLLHYASKVPNLTDEKQQEMLKVIEILESNGALFCFDKKGRTPLHYASANNYTIIARYYIGKDAKSLLLQDAEGNTPFDLAASEKMKKFISNINTSMKKAKEAKENKFIKLHKSYLTPEDIEDMIKHDYKNALRSCIKSGKISVNYRFRENPHFTLLHVAAKYDSINCFFFLVSHKADLNVVDDNKNTAFQVAAMNNSVSVLTAFIDLDFKPTEQNSQEMLKLTGEMNESYYILDSYIDYTHIVYDFFQNYDIKSLTYNFFTKLIFFDMCILNPPVALSIIEAKILNINAVNTFGENAIYHIVKYGDEKDQQQHDLIKHLVKWGCNPNAQRLDGNTPLHAALISKNEGFIETLIAYGGDDTIPNDNGTIVRNFIE